MSVPLKDFRTSVTEGIHAMLEARAIAEGTDMQTVARNVLARWAACEHRAHMVYAKRLHANGPQADWITGEPVSLEDDGTRRSGPEKRR